ncbi:hypothetical protein EVAR_38654_1 [Eumeta japonica]|uniref:Uncharacterized protein n=1 Tax=Eumeta variegata TaxID=151549 RepID=A0A4C1Y1J0_EUMVA|nr:hypothetical protein EVAR_38654_1 [Eumeta japonica]
MATTEDDINSVRFMIDIDTNVTYQQIRTRLSIGMSQAYSHNSTWDKKRVCRLMLRIMLKYEHTTVKCYTGHWDRSDSLLSDLFCLLDGCLKVIANQKENNKAGKKLGPDSLSVSARSSILPKKETKVFIRGLFERHVKNIQTDVKSVVHVLNKIQKYFWCRNAYAQRRQVREDIKTIVILVRSGVGESSTLARPRFDCAPYLSADACDGCEI